MEQNHKVNVELSDDNKLQIVDEKDIKLSNGVITGTLYIANMNKTKNKIPIRFTVYTKEGYIVYDDVQYIHFTNYKPEDIEITITPDIRENETDLTLKLSIDN